MELGVWDHNIGHHEEGFDLTISVYEQLELMVRRHQESVSILLKYQKGLNSYQSYPGQNGLEMKQIPFVRGI